MGYLGLKWSEILEELPKVKALLDKELEDEKWAGDDATPISLQHLFLRWAKRGWPRIVDMVKDLAKGEADADAGGGIAPPYIYQPPLSPVGHAIAGVKLQLGSLMHDATAGDREDQALKRAEIMEAYAEAMRAVEPEAWALMSEIREQAPSFAALPGDQATMKGHDWQRRLSELERAVSEADQARDTAMQELFPICQGHPLPDDPPDFMPEDLHLGDQDGGDTRGGEGGGSVDDGPAGDVPPPAGG